MSDSLQPYGLKPARLLHPWDSPGKNTGMGCHVLLQGIFQTRESYDGEFRMPLVLAQGSPISHSSCEGKLGIALE